MSALLELLQELSARNVKLSVDGGQLRIRAPKGSVDAILRDRLAAHKAALLDFLGQEAISDDALPRVAPDPARRHEPFPLTDLQQAYWIGSLTGIERSGGYHYYLEFDGPDLDVERLNRAWQTLIDRHEMLRAIVLPDGRQQILAEVPPYRFVIRDLSNADDEDKALTAVREELSHHSRALDQWPLSEVQVSRLSGGRIRVHVSLGLITLDSGSMMILFHEWQLLYRDLTRPLPPLAISFRDYAIAEQRLQETAVYRRAERYWLNRLAELPPAPELPLARAHAEAAENRFYRLTGRLDAGRWEVLKQRAVRFGITPSALLLTAFSEILATWSANPCFTLNVTLFNRLPIAAGINDIVGDFTSVTLLAVDFSRRRPFVEHAAEVNRQLRDDLDHRAFSGVKVLREWAKMQGSTGRPLAPVVFSSTLVLGTKSDFSLHKLFGGKLHYAISQTPQCHLDHQLLEDDGQLIFHWDVVQGFYPDGMVEDMFAAYGQLLDRLASADASMTESRPAWVPEAQRLRHAEINRTDAPVSDRTLIELFTAQVAAHPQTPAVIASDRRLSYGELELRARRVAHWLKSQEVAAHELVAVSMVKGWEQVVAVLGTLMAGAAYVPVDPDLPEQRRAHLLRETNARAVLTQSWLLPALDLAASGVRFLAVDQQSQIPDPPPGVGAAPDSLAYVLFTSGSTGLPKGVMIEQRSVVHRMLEVTQRLGIGPDDRAIALTALHHDLSVFDVFGMLCCAGGALVLPDADQIREPAHWHEIIVRERVTVWNSVPAFMGMLAEHLETSVAPEQRPSRLRWCILSGDFIPVALPGHIRKLLPGIQVLAAGGPTETTVWDICHSAHEVDESLPSIPYGRPMANARYHVLKENLDVCPDWTPGELVIGGIGLARGYWNDAAATAEKFITHPESGERLYRSGDVGRYLPDGNIEILARKDFQVKIQGQRIELGEIEAALEGLAQVKRAVVTVQQSPERRQLVAHIVLANGHHHTAADATDAFVQGQASSAAAGLRSDAERMEFKLRQPGVMRAEPGIPLLQLPGAAINPDERKRFLARQSHRRFTGQAVLAEHLSEMLAGFRQLSVDYAPLPKYFYPSAGSLYPVQTYLHLKSGGVTGLPAGLYYYQPQHHALLAVGKDEQTESLYGGPNQGLLDECGFAIFLIGNMEAIEPIYPGAGREFCLLEAGHMGQVLMERATDQDIGLCPIGIGVDEQRLRSACGLGSYHSLAYSFAGGRLAAASKDHWMTYSSPADAWHEPIRQALSNQLPIHMVPSVFKRWDALPLTGNGKIDRRRLAQEAVAPVEAALSQPATDIEARLAALLAGLLGVTAVGIHTQFFELGANSVTLVQFRNRIQQTWGRQIPMAELFSRGTIHLLADLLLPQPQDATDDTTLLDMVGLAKRQKRALARRR
jgi:epothilone synthetase B